MKKLLALLLAATLLTGCGSTGSDDTVKLTGTSDGHNGPLTVEVEMQGDTITAVTVTDHIETVGIADPALTNVPEAIVAANSTDVDVVVGATITSAAIVTAVDNAIASK